MRKMLLFGVLIPLLLVSCAVYAAGQWVHYRAWQDACTLSKYSCEGIPRPHIEHDDISLAAGLYGYYIPGTSVIFVSRGMDSGLEYAVLVHETVHYLQYQSAKRGRTLLPSKCMAELEAFEVSDRILLREGAPVWVRDGNLSDYGCK